jgi:hypothetical protein
MGFCVVTINAIFCADVHLAVTGLKPEAPALLKYSRLFHLTKPENPTVEISCGRD